MRSCLVTRAVLGALLCSTPPAFAVTFTRVANTSTPIPAGQWAGQPFGDFSASGIPWAPSLDHGDVIFLGKPAFIDQNGAFTWNASAGLSLLADPSIPIPNRAGAHFSFIRYPTVQGGNFAFSSVDGIYRTSNGSLTRVIDPSTLAPPSNVPFRGTSAPSLDGANTWFFGELNDPGVTDGVYRSAGGSLTAVATQGTPTPGSPGLFFSSLNSNVHASQGRVAFYAGSGPDPSSPVRRGIYQFNGSSLERIADTTLPAPGSPALNFAGFSNYPLSSDGPDVAFVGYTLVSGNAVPGLYARRSGSLTRIAVSGQPAPGGGSFIVEPDYGFSLDAGHVALSTRTAVYTDYFGTLTRAFGAGDTLDGRTLSSILLSPDALSGHQLAFLATFTNGSSGIYVAAIPEPSTAATLALAVTGLATTRRRR